MKLTLHVEAEDKGTILTYLLGPDMYCALCDIRDDCRKYVKYGHDFESVEDLATHIREKIAEVISGVE